MTIIFTHSDQTEKRFSVKQAYKQAAMVIRDRQHKDLLQCEQVFHTNSQGFNDDRKTLTLKELSDTVNVIADRYSWYR